MSPPPIHISHGAGAELFDAEGNAYIDAISSWWVNLHGHNHSYIAKYVYKQLKKLEHVLFAGFTHEPAVKLAKRLLARLPKDQKKIFFSDNGSTAVEVAAKAAIQYWSNIGKPRYKFVSFENSYHGDTFGAMSLSAPSVFTKHFKKNLFQVFHIPVPDQKNHEVVLDKMQKIFEKEKIAAFIFEPLIQGAGGMIMYEPKYLDQLIGVCREHKVLTIADEVMTGFGRLGRFTASELLKKKPDILCLSKGITGGYLPLGVTAFSDRVFKPFVTSDRSKTFFHGHSYTANPLSCAAALASLDILERKSTWDNIRKIENRHREFLEKIKEHPLVKEVRRKGTILAIEIETGSKTSYLNDVGRRLYDFYIRKKVILRPLGNVVYTLPPYCISKKQLMRVYTVIEESLKMLEDEV